jgi:hypothetical protein
LKHGEPLLFGENNEWTLLLDRMEVKKVEAASLDQAQWWIHDETSKFKAHLLSQLGQGEYHDLPVAMGVIYKNPRKFIEKQYDDYNSTLEQKINQGKIKEM